MRRANGTKSSYPGGRCATALRTADLRPDVLVIAHQLHEQLEARRSQRLRDVRATHVIDDHDRRQRRDELVQLRQILRFEVDDDVPAERLDALGDLHQHFARRDIHQALHEVERTPRTPAASISRSCSSVKSLVTVATPRARPSTSAAHRPSRGCPRRGVACTITLRSKPR